MFFYLHCGWGFNYLHGRQMKRCLINWSLCGKPQKKFLSTQSATSHFTHLYITVRLTPTAEHTRHRAFFWLRPGQCLLWHVSSLPMFLEAEAGLPTGMGGRGSCPAHANISLIRVSRKSLCEIFFPPHEEKSITIDNGQVQQVEKELFCPLPCSTAGRVAIGHPICIINMPPAEHPQHPAFFWLRPGQCLLWHVSSLPMF